MVDETSAVISIIFDASGATRGAAEMDAAKQKVIGAGREMTLEAAQRAVAITRNEQQIANERVKAATTAQQKATGDAAIAARQAAIEAQLTKTIADENAKRARLNLTGAQETARAANLGADGFENATKRIATASSSVQKMLDGIARGWDPFIASADRARKTLDNLLQVSQQVNAAGQRTTESLQAEKMLPEARSRLETAERNLSAGFDVAKETERLTAAFAPAIDAAAAMKAEIADLNRALSLSIDVEGGQAAQLARIAAKYNETAKAVLAFNEALRAASSVGPGFVRGQGNQSMDIDKTRALISEFDKGYAITLQFNAAMGRLNELEDAGIQIAGGYGAARAALRVGYEKDKDAVRALLDVYGQQQVMEKVLADRASGSSARSAGFSAVDQTMALTDDQRKAARTDDVTAALNAGDVSRARFDSIFANSQKYAKDWEDLNAVIKQLGLTEAQATVLHDNLRASIDRGVGPVEKEAAAMDRLRSKWDPMHRLQTQYKNDLAEIDKLSRQTTDGLSPEAATKAKADALAYYNRGLKDIESGGRNAAFAVRQVGVQFTQGLSGIATGQDLFTVLIQQGHQLIDVSLATGTGFKALGEAAKQAWTFIRGPVVGPTLGFAAVAAAITAVSVAAENQNLRLARLSVQAAGVRDNYKEVAQAAEDAAKELARTSTLSTDDARSVTGTFAKSRDFAGGREEMVQLGKASKALADTLSIDATEAAKMFVAAIGDPVKAAIDLDARGLKGFGDEFQRYLRDLAAGGKYNEAFIAILNRAAIATKEGNKSLTDFDAMLQNLGRSLTGVGQSGRSFIQNMGQPFLDMATTVGNSLTWVINKLSELGAKFPTVAKTIRDAIMALPGIGVVNGAIASAFVPSTSSTTGTAGTTTGTTGATTGATGRNGMPVTGNIPTSTANLIYTVAEQRGIDAVIADFATRIAQVESGGRQYDKTGGVLTSSAGALGIMQVMPDSTWDATKSTTARTINGVTYDLTQESSNVAAGLAELARLSKVLGGDLSKIAVGYNAGQGVATGQVRQNPKAYAETTGYLQKLDLPDPRGTSTTQATVAGAIPSTATFANEADIAKRKGDDLLKTINVLSDQQKENRRQFDELNESYVQHKQVRDRLLEVEPRTDATTKAIDEETAAMNRQVEGMRQLNGDLQRLDTTQRLMARSAEDANKALSAEQGAPRTVAENLERLKVAARDAGQELDRSAAARVMAADLKRLSVEADDATAAINRQTMGLTRLTPMLEKGGLAAEYAANHEKALEDARATSLPNTAERARQVEAETAALNANSLAKRENQAATDFAKTNQDIEYLKLEATLINASTEARMRELTVLKEKQRYGLTGADTPTPQIQKQIDAATEAAKRGLDIKQQQANLQELSGFYESAFNTIGSSIVDAFDNGKSALQNFADLSKTLTKMILNEFLKLAVINPLLNSLFPGTGTRPTLGGVINAGGAANDNVSSAAATVGNTTMEAAAASGATVATGGFTVEFHRGGVVGSGGVPRFVHPAYFDDAPRFHTGMKPSLAHDEFPAILQRGERVLTEKQDDRVLDVVGKLTAVAMGKNPALVDTHNLNKRAHDQFFDLLTKGEEVASARKYHDGGVVGIGGVPFNASMALFANAPRFHEGGAYSDELAAAQSAQQEDIKRKADEQKQFQGEQGVGGAANSALMMGAMIAKLIGKEGLSGITKFFSELGDKASSAWNWLTGGTSAAGGVASGAMAASAAFDPSLAGAVFATSAGVDVAATAGGAGTSFLTEMGFFTPLAHEGWRVGLEAPPAVRAVGPGFFENLPRMHTGSPMGYDEFGAILQRGERVLTAPQQRAMVAAANGEGGDGGGTTNNFNFNLPGIKDRQTGETFLKSAPHVMRQALDEQIRSKNRNG